MLSWSGIADRIEIQFKLPTPKPEEKKEEEKK